MARSRFGRSHRPLEAQPTTSIARQHLDPLSTVVDLPHHPPSQSPPTHYGQPYSTAREAHAHSLCTHTQALHARTHTRTPSPVLPDGQSPPVARVGLLTLLSLGACSSRPCLASRPTHCSHSPRLSDSHTTRVAVTVASRACPALFTRCGCLPYHTIEIEREASPFALRVITQALQLLPPRQCSSAEARPRRQS